MRKNKTTPEQALQFLEDFRLMSQNKDEPTQAISIRIPANLLRMIKSKAQFENKKYQSLIIEFMRNGISQI